eukprot:scaffold21388_cov96-Isochrysis_galbana.AAC.1
MRQALGAEFHVRCWSDVAPEVFSQPLTGCVLRSPCVGLRVFRQDGTSIPHTAPRACGSRGRTLPRTCPTWCHKAFPLSACPFLWAIAAWESRLRWQGQPPLRCAQAGPRPHLFKRPIHPPLLFLLYLRLRAALVEHEVCVRAPVAFAGRRAANPYPSQTPMPT